MSEMLEKVARALALADYGWEVVDPHGFWAERVPDRGGLTANSECGCDERFRGKDDYRRLARAALLALREPTEEMVEAMHEAMFQDAFDGTSAPMLGAGFEAAIDAALTETQETSE